MATSGQTLNDRINAARYTLAGQGLARYVCKATTEEVIGPKKKHLDYLLACTHEANVSIPQLANLLIERTNHISWVVVFKALVTVHHLMSYGNERLIQYIASSNYSFELSTFLDKTSARDFSMSTFIKRYSRYINEKAVAYRILAFDFCKIKRGTEGVLRQMPMDRLLKTLPVLQNQLDALLEFDCTVGDLNNGVIISCFMLLFRDLIGLFACHNDGIINLLNKYFTLNKKLCRDALDLYKKFLVRMDKVNDFLRVAEAVGLDKDDIPDLRRAPSSLIDALEQHLQNLEANRKTSKINNNNNSKLSKSEFTSILDTITPPNSSTVRPSSPASMNSTGGTSRSVNKLFDNPVTISSFKDDEVQKALEEEARVLSLYGFNGDAGIQLKTPEKPPMTIQDLTFSVPAQVQEPFKTPAHTTPKVIDDIFGDANSFTKASTDVNGSSFMQAPNYTSLSGLEGFGEVLQPSSTNSMKSNGRNPITSKNSFVSTTSSQGSAMFKGDLDSILANLAQNLTFEGTSKNKK